MYMYNYRKFLRISNYVVPAWLQLELLFIHKPFIHRTLNLWVPYLRLFSGYITEISKLQDYIVQLVSCIKVLYVCAFAFALATNLDSTSGKFISSFLLSLATVVFSGYTYTNRPYSIHFISIYCVGSTTYTV